MKFIAGKALRAVLPRLGTGLGSFLAGMGLAADHASAIVSAVILLAGVGTDMLMNGEAK